MNFENGRFKSYLRFGVFLILLLHFLLVDSIVDRAVSRSYLIERYGQNRVESENLTLKHTRPYTFIVSNGDRLSEEVGQALVSRQFNLCGLIVVALLLLEYISIRILFPSFSKYLFPALRKDPQEYVQEKG